MNNTIKTLIRITVSALVLLLSACGGGGSSSGGGGGGSSPASSTTPTVRTGSFIDAPVKGLTYRTTTQSGVTDTQGIFKYISGEMVEFYLGNVKLGEALGASELYPSSIASQASYEIKIAQLLQSLDIDNDLSNGIDVGTQTWTTSTNIFNGDDVNQALLTQLRRGVIPTLISVADARRHLNENRNLAGSTVLSKNTLLENNNVNMLVATLSGGTDYSLNALMDNNAFTISGNEIRIKASADFETKASYEISISTNEGINIFTITVINLVESIDDADGDFIPDNIEVDLLSMSPSLSDQNENGVVDGLDSDGANGDEFFKYQWHLRSLGNNINWLNRHPILPDINTIIGNDLDVIDIYHKYMGYNNGNPIVVQALEGIEESHEDLIDNIDLAKSIGSDGHAGSSMPGSNPLEIAHGTGVAGIIAGRGFNGRGIRGIAPFAKVAGSALPLNNSDHYNLTLATEWVTGPGADDIAITNNSWGFDEGARPSEQTAIENNLRLSTRTLRAGKGRVQVFGSGNDRRSGGDASAQFLLSNRYGIAVGAIGYNNAVANYSTPGANLWLSGYSGNIDNSFTLVGITTAIPTGSARSGDTFSADTNRNYRHNFNGTSAAAPMVSGSLALVLEACPNLSARDVKYLSAKTARVIRPTDSSWITNSASIRHSRDFGFGLINAKGMIAQCQGSYVALGAETTRSNMVAFNQVIADDNTAQDFIVNIADNLLIEWVEVTVDNNNVSAGDYRIEVTSPLGTKILLVSDDIIAAELSWMNGGFRFAAAGFLDETSQGDWTIHITDTEENNVGTLNSIKVEVIGRLP